MEKTECPQCPRTVWLLWASDGRRQWVVGVYANKDRAEAAPLEVAEGDEGRGWYVYWLQEKEMTK